jgi:VIT1/CCC1 family predicted Fe2+/Mn2+ transporter
MVRAFPAPVRYSGVSFSYNIAYPVFGGLTPLLVSWLIHLDRMAPAHYVAGVTALGLLATLMAPASGREPAGAPLRAATTVASAPLPADLFGGTPDIGA